MRGTIRSISLPRRLIIEMMRASKQVPLVSLRRKLAVGPMLDARQGLVRRPGYAAIFAKAFSLVAKEQPVLRTLYVTWPWPHFYELPRSVGMVAVSRRWRGEDCVLPQKLTAPDELALSDIDALIRHAMTAEVEAVPMFRKLLRIVSYPWPLRRLIWTAGLNLGRQRANYVGSFGITSVSAFGPGELHAISPGPFLLTYGEIRTDRTVEVVIRWDHRVTDAAMIAVTLTRLEQVLNGEISAEMQAGQPVAEQKPVRAVEV
jgi:hypothetical protein